MILEKQGTVARLSAHIKRNEDGINAIVYRLFDLTAGEIRLLEGNVAPR